MSRQRRHIGVAVVAAAVAVSVVSAAAAQRGAAAGGDVVHAATLTLTLPSGWKVQLGRPPKQSAVRAYVAAGAGKGIALVADAYQGPAATFMKQETRYDRTVNTQASNVRVVSRRLARGTKAWIVSYFLPAGGDPHGAVQLQYFVARSGHTVWLTFTARASLRGAYASMFDRIAASAQPKVKPAPSKPASAAVVRYTDPVGDAHGAADIRALSVSADSAGTVHFTIGFAKPFSISSNEVAISIDADDDPATGNVAGFDYWLVVNDGHASLLSASTGGPTAAPTLRFGLAGTTLTATINRSDLGGTRAFRFYAWTQAGSVYGDDAPGGRKVLTYVLPSAKPTS